MKWTEIQAMWKEDGYEKGHAEGHAEGKLQGEIIGNIKMARKCGISESEIIKDLMTEYQLSEAKAYQICNEV